MTATVVRTKMATIANTTRGSHGSSSNSSAESTINQDCHATYLGPSSGPQRAYVSQTVKLQPHTCFLLHLSSHNPFLMPSSRPQPLERGI